MKDYSLFCTEAQTQSALGLGAPIEYAKVVDTINGNSIRIPEETGEFYLIPTAEEMIGWLEEQGIYVETKVNQRTDGVTNFVYNVTCGSYASLNNEVIFFDSRKEATLAAIDAALEYLENLKQ